MRIGRPLPDLNLWTLRDLDAVALARLTALDDAGLGGGAAHIQRNQVRLSQHFAVKARRKRACRRPRFQHPYRTLARRVGAHDAARRVHHQKLAAVAQFSQVALDATNISGDGWLDIGVRGDG